MSATFSGQLTKIPAEHPEVEADVAESFHAPTLSRGVVDSAVSAFAAAEVDPPTKPPVLDNVIRVSFPGDIPPKLVERFNKVKGHIDMWHSWVQGKTGELIEKKQKAGELPIDVENVDSKIKVDNYGARVFDTYLRNRSPWLPVFYRDTKKLDVTEKKFDLHNTILKTVLNDFVAEPRLQAKLEGAFDLITKAISFGVNKTKLDRTIWIMLEYYIYDAPVDTIRPVVRTISFDAGVDSREYTSKKAQYKEVTTKLHYYQTDAKFVQETWDLAEKDIKEAVAKETRRVVTEDFDVPVNA